MNDISLKIELRTAEGRQITQIRKQGFVPSVVYGGHADPISTQSQEVETLKAVKTVGKHSPVNLVLDGKKMLAIIKSIDFSPVSHKIRHVAFHTIKQNEIITTEVPIILTNKGESIAERAGLVILQAIEAIEIKAKPADLPQSLALSVLELATDEDKLTVGDLMLPKGVEFADIDQDKELVIANIYEPGALQAANEAAGGDADSDIAEEVIDTSDNKISDSKTE